MTVQVVAITSINANAGDALDRYMGVVGPLMESVGAKVVNRYELLDSIAGSNDIQYVSFIEYPDEASLKLVFDSDEYRSLVEVKRQAFSKYQVSTAATM